MNPTGCNRRPDRRFEQRMSRTRVVNPVYGWRWTAAAVAAVALAVLAPCASAQSGLQDLPGYEQYRAARETMGELARLGRIGRVQWSDDGRRLTYERDDVRYSVDLSDGSISELAEDDNDDENGSSARRRAQRSRYPGRGRQRDSEPSPNGRWTAECRDWNVFLLDTETDGTTPLTTDGWRKFRYGKASWVYGEELDQNQAMWWSPDSKKLVYYVFDERDVPDHYLVTGWTELHTDTQVEGYPKPGEPNPVVGLKVYDVGSGATIEIDATTDPEQYVYGVRFAPNGGELLFFRTNRRQNRLDLVAADPETGDTRIVVTETQETWQDNRPTMRFLEDGRRFIWQTERTGWAQYELRDLDGNRLATLTEGAYPVDSIERVDEDRNELWYTAFSGANPLNAHLHRVGLDGSNAVRLTGAQANHTSIDIAPNGDWFVATYETISAPATTVLYDRDGSAVATLAEADQSKVVDSGVQLPELFTCTAADGETTLYGVLYKPTDFDAERTYPLLIDVYGGPFSQGVRNRFRGGRAECEFGYLVAEIDNRGTINRGKAFESANYMKLGDVDLADQVAGVRHLVQRPYVDGDRVGIVGHSYGGYMSALAILKYPDVFHAAVAGSPVTDWRQYDSIYTERYMRTPDENAQGYDDGSCMTYADQLQGRLLLQHGLLDNNVHPSNTFALVEAIREAGGDCDVSIYPDRDHRLGGGAYVERMRYLIRHLVEPELELVY